jgi:hypothetical protein
MIVWLSNRSCTAAPRSVRRCTSAETESGARKSKCMRFLADGGSTTFKNREQGPPKLNRGVKPSPVS